VLGAIGSPAFAPPASLHEREVREIMTPGVVTIVEDASVRQARRAMLAHRVHGVLVVGRSEGKPLGWVTARGLLGWVGRDESIAAAREAITESPSSIGPSVRVSDAVRELSQPGVSRLLVQRRPDVLPEGVVSEVDLLKLGDG
jgi:CBS domain-containing protein